MAMKGIRVAAISMNSPLAQVENVLSATDSWCRKAADQGVELVLFPELLIHGHCTPNTWAIAEAVPDGPSLRRLIGFARQYDLFLSVGLSEKENNSQKKSRVKEAHPKEEGRYGQNTTLI